MHGRTAADNSDAILQLARSGLGIARLADWLVEEDLRAERLVSLLDDYDPSPAPIFARTPPGRYTKALVRMLIEHLVSSLAATYRGINRARLDGESRMPRFLIRILMFLNHAPHP